MHCNDDDDKNEFDYSDDDDDDYDGLFDVPGHASMVKQSYHHWTILAFGSVDTKVISMVRRENLVGGILLLTTVERRSLPNKCPPDSRMSPIALNDTLSKSLKWHRCSQTNVDLPGDNVPLDSWHWVTVGNRPQECLLKIPSKAPPLSSRMVAPPQLIHLVELPKT